MVPNLFVDIFISMFPFRAAQSVKYNKVTNGTLYWATQMLDCLGDVIDSISELQLLAFICIEPGL